MTTEGLIVMTHQNLAESFEECRSHLRGVAYRMLGSLSEADDAVQEAWLRLSRSDTREIENLKGWLTTVVGRVALDMLRSRKARPEEPVGTEVPENVGGSEGSVDPEHEAQLADSVGLALLVVLETLAPGERLAFVLHDLFAMPFEEIATIVGRTPTAARQLASRARRRVRGASPSNEAELANQRHVVDAFLAALRGGDYDALVSVLDPNVVVRADSASVPPGAPREIHGAAASAKLALGAARGARAARTALVNGSVGIIVAPRGKLLRVLRFTFAGGKIIGIDVEAEPETLRELELGVLDA